VWQSPHPVRKGSGQGPASSAAEGVGIRANLSRLGFPQGEKSESPNANARVPKGRNSLAQHGAEGGVLGRVGNEPEPLQGRHRFFLCRRLKPAQGS